VAYKFMKERQLSYDTIRNELKSEGLLSCKISDSRLVVITSETIVGPGESNNPSIRRIDVVNG
jgi:hypothetical protein